MKKLIVISLVVVVSFVLVASAFASMKTVEFAGGGAGKVVFDGAAHKAKGLDCKACHPGIFQMKKGGVKITMAEINAGKLCGTCHKEGGQAFPAKDCAKCHKK